MYLAKHIYPLILEGVLISIFLLIIYNLKDLWSSFKSIKPRTWILISLIFFSGLLIRVFIVPHTHYVYFDEYQHVSRARNVLHSNRLCQCIMGSPEECSSCTLAMPWPGGYHVFLGSALRLFGDTENVVFNFNAIIGSLSVIVMFLLIYLTFQDSKKALLGALIFNFIPVHLKYSGSASIGVLSIFFVLLSLLFLETYKRKRKYSIFLLALLALYYTLQIRTENFLILLIVLIYTLTQNKDFKNRLSKPKYLIPIFIFLILSMPLIKLIHFGTTRSNAPGYQQSFSDHLKNLKNFLPGNLFFFINPRFNSILLSFICLFGAKKLHSEDKKKLIVYSLFFFLFFSFYSSYRLGNLPHTDPSRYSLILYIPIILISVNILDIKEVPFRKITLILILTLYFLALMPTRQFIFAPRQLHSKEYEFILDSRSKIPESSYVISYSPSAITSTIHRRSVSPDMFLHNKRAFSDEDLILFKDYWYREKEHSQVLEKEIKKNYSLKLIRNESVYGYGKKYEFGFYNLTPKQPLS